MIQVQHLSKSYEDPDGNVIHAVADATLTCQAGEIYGLVGPNGAGKTTTLRCLSTILSPTAGTARIAGFDVVTQPQDVRRSIGFLSASIGLYHRLTPRETLTFFAQLYGMPAGDVKARVEQVMTLFDITSYADRPNDRLSTGMKQRVGLARAVVHDPPVLILDEPTSGLDPIVSRTVERAVQSLAAAGKCVLFSTHLLDQAEAICSRIGIIGRGSVLAEGTVAELCSKTGTGNLRGAFFALVGEERDAVSIVRSVFVKELREMLRDRRSLAVMFGLPLVLYPLLAIGVATLGTTKKKELTDRVARVVVTNPQAVPHLLERLGENESGVELVTPPPGKDLAGMLLAGEIDAAVEVPADLESSARLGTAVEVNVLLDRSRTTADFAEKKLRKQMDAYQRWLIEQRLKERDVPVSVLAPVAMTTRDVASRAQVFGHLLGQALPVLLMMTGMLGALFPALNATTTERELGTLEALLLTPASRLELLVAKGVLVLLCGLLTAGLNMLSMSLVLLRAFSMIGGPASNLSLSPGMLLLSYLAAVPAMIFFSAVVLMVGLVARNFREANTFATPVMLIPLASFAIGMMEPAATPALLITPVANTTIVIREVLTGRATVGQFALAFASSCLYAGILLSMAGRLFSSEQLVNPAWEPVSLRSLKRNPNRRLRMPAVDEALVLFCIVLLLLFYVSPVFLKHGLLAAAAGNEVVLILAPALIMAKLAGWKWADTFGLHRPRAAALTGAALIGIGLPPWVSLFQDWQNRLWPADPESARAQSEMFVTALQTFPVIKVIVIGLLAGTCEEMLFRGPLQNSMLRKIPAWAAIGFAAVLFAAIHLDVHGFPVRLVLGVLLGYIAWRGGSILPAMLAHGLYDTTALSLGAWQIHHGVTEAGITSLDRASMAVGAVLIITGVMVWWIGRTPLPQRNPEPAG